MRKKKQHTTTTTSIIETNNSFRLLSYSFLCSLFSFAVSASHSKCPFTLSVAFGLVRVFVRLLFLLTAIIYLPLITSDSDYELYYFFPFSLLLLLLLLLVLFLKKKKDENEKHKIPANSILSTKCLNWILLLMRRFHEIPIVDLDKKKSGFFLLLFSAF